MPIPTTDPAGRSTFGGTDNDFLFRTVAGGLVKLQTGYLTYWDAEVDGNQYTDLLLDGEPTEVIPADDLGYYPAFQGPSGVTQMWAESSTTNRRTLVVAIRDLAAKATQIVDDAFAAVESINRDQPNGVAPLDANNLLPASKIPPRFKAAATEVNVGGYDVRPTNTATQNDAGLAALFADYPNGVALAFPEVGTYLFNAPLPNRDNLSVRGVSCGSPMDSGGGTLLRVANGMFVGSGSATMSGLYMSDIAVDNSGGSKPIFDMGALGLINSTFERVDLRTAVNAQPIFKARDAVNVFGVRIRDSYVRRNQTASVPAFDVISNGGGVNGWTVEASVVHSYNCNTSPFFRFESTSAGSYVNNMVFRDLIGEQNVGGLVHLYGAVMCNMTNIVEWDAAAYTDDLFRVDTSSSGRQSYSCEFDNVGTPGAVTFAAGKGHVRAVTGFGHQIGRVVNGPTASPTVTTNGENRWGSAPTRPVSTRTASGTLAIFDHTVMFNGSSLTCTLPDPVANGMPPGRDFTVKNIAASALTVTGEAGRVIDGSTTRSIPSAGVATFRTDGTNWIVV